MPRYIYTAKSYSGETKGGEIVAKDEKSLAQQLRSEGYLITSMKLMEEKGSKIKVGFLDNFFGSVPLKEKMIFARNLSVMIASGVNISKALFNLTLQTRNKNFKKILLDIHEDIQGGKAFSDSLAKYPRAFNELFVNMVRVGETAGNLEEVLKIIADQLEKEHELLSKVRGALIYPAVIVTVMIGIGILMLTYILPKITSVFADMEVKLPPTTRFIMAVSDLLRNHIVLIIVFLIAFALFLKFFLKTIAGKRTVSFLTVNLPIIKNIVIKVNCARFARIHSSLLRSGVSVVDSLGIISRTLTNYSYSNEIKKAVEQIQKGENLSKIIGLNTKIFPVLVSQMLEVGEETGKTEAVLMKLAEFYEEEVNQITKNLSSIIEPVLMVLIGGSVGFFAVSMLQPMYSLMENIK